MRASARVGLTELCRDEADGRVLTIGPPWAAGVHRQTSAYSLARSRDAARRPLNGRIHVCCSLVLALPHRCPSVFICGYSPCSSTRSITNDKIA